MDMMDGLAGTLAGMQEDAMEAAKMAGGLVLGATIAKSVDVWVSEQTWAKDAAGAPSAATKWGIPVGVTALGLFLFSRFRGSYPALAGANGLGMMGYGIGKLVKLAVGQFAAEQTETVNKYLGLGAVDNYESALVMNGLGYDMSINRYLRNGPSLMGLGDDRSPGAPVFVETVSGAPTSITQISGAPTQISTISGLHGLSATLM